MSIKAIFFLSLLGKTKSWMIYEQFENESDTSVSKDDDSDWIKVLTNRGCVSLFASVNSEPYEISCIVAVYG